MQVKASPQSMDDSGLVTERWPRASGGDRKLHSARPRVREKLAGPRPRAVQPKRGRRTRGRRRYCQRDSY